jgi:excisionase family DNA binding protein
LAGKEYLRVPEAAQLLGVSSRALRERVMRGEIPSIKVGKARLIPLRLLDAWVEEQARLNQMR